jgi:crossover junction endodeoxyribonuclease RusA
MIPAIADTEAERVLVVIDLPWPDKRLSPNARQHWAVKSAIVKKARADAHLYTLEAAGYALGTLRATLAGEGPIPVHIALYPPDRRLRDRDNMQHSLKHALDGIADALHVNDRRFHPSYTFGTPEKPGKVVVTVG